MLVAQRQARVAALVQEVVSELIFRRIKDPRIGFVSIVKVDVPRDMSLARIYVSVLGSDQEKEKTMEGLRSAQGLIRSEVAKVLGMRHAPEVQFVLDEGIEHSIRVSKLLSEIKTEENKGPQEEER